MQLQANYLTATWYNNYLAYKFSVYLHFGSDVHKSYNIYDYTVSHINVHIGVSDGFPTQPLLGATTRLNCSVTPNPQISHTFLTIQYQWYTNSTLRESVQELVLTNLSAADATTYSCVVTISSSNPTLLIRQISNQSTYELTIKSEQ